MPSLLGLIRVVPVCAFAASSLCAQARHDLAPFLIEDRAAEIALARTAAPRAVRDSASVLIFTRTGYVLASRGTNGFTCLVMRGFTARAGDPVYWNPRNRGPACFNPAASKSVLPAIVKQVEWVVSGMEPAAVDARLRAAYAKHDFPMPAEGSMAYMLSREQYLTDDAPHAWYPHIMVFYSTSVRSSEWAANGSPGTVFDPAADGEPWPVLTLFIPVRKWSDGTTAMDGAGH